jgi:N6-adenosine-specific RNA methylase IME4
VIAVRGRVSPPPSCSEPSVLFAPRRGHSVKPVEFFTSIEKDIAPMPRLEMFARRSRPGWVAWGNEATKFDEEMLL